MAKIEDNLGRFRPEADGLLGRLQANVDKTKLVVAPITPATNSNKWSVRPNPISYPVDRKIHLESAIE